MHILEDDSPFFMIHSTDHESLLLFDADLDPSRGLDPAGNCRKCSVESRLNRDRRNFSTQAARLHSLDISRSSVIPEGKLLLGYDLDLELPEMGYQPLPLRVVPQDDPSGSSFTLDTGKLHRRGQQSGQVVDARRCFACQESEVEVLKLGHNHAQPQFAMMPCILAPDRDRLNVGFPNFIGSGKAAEAALHERRAFAQVQLLVVLLHRLLPSLLQSIRLTCLPPADDPYRPQSLRLLPCFPAQKGQNGQSSPTGKSSPSSCGQPMLPSLIATDVTPCSLKNSMISRWIFGLVITSVATHRLMIALEFFAVNTPAAILVVVLSSGP